MYVNFLVLANSANPDQTAPIPRSDWSYNQIRLLLYPDQTASITDCSYKRLQIRSNLIMGYTVCHSVFIFWKHFPVTELLTKIQFSTHFWIVPKSEIRASLRSFPDNETDICLKTYHRSWFIFIPLPTTVNEITIEYWIIDRQTTVLFLKYVCEIKLTLIIPKKPNVPHLSCTGQEGLSSAHWIVIK